MSKDTKHQDALLGVEKRVFHSFERIAAALEERGYVVTDQTVATLTLAATMEDVLDTLPAAGRGY